VVKKQRQKSNKSVMERLQNHVNKALVRTALSKEKENLKNNKGLKQLDISKDDVESKESDEYEKLEGEDEEYDMDEAEYENLNGEDEDNEEVDENEIETEDVEAKSDNDKKINELNEGKQDDFEWFFNFKADQPSTNLTKEADNKSSSSYRNDLQFMTSFKDFQIYAGLHPSLTKQQRLPVNSMGNIQGLQKIFRSRGKEEIKGKLSRELLPYLDSYADMLLEGRDHTNDDDILSATLLHVCNHVVRARTKVVKHNQKSKKRSTEIAIAAAAANAEDGKKKKKAAREALKRDAEDQANESFPDQGCVIHSFLILLCHNLLFLFSILTSSRVVLFTGG
jgi:hypothetical protein